MESLESNNSQLLNAVATDLAKIVSVDCTSKRTELSKEVIAATNYLEYNNGIINQIVTNRKKVCESLPTVLSQYESLQQLFEPLDKLGRLVERVRTDVTQLEAAVAAAEERLLGEQPTLAHRILQPVLRKLDSDTVNDNSLAADGSFQAFDPSDYLVASSLWTDRTSADTLPLIGSSPPVEAAEEAFCLDNLSSFRVSNFPMGSGIEHSDLPPNNNTTERSVQAEQLLLDDDELCSS